MIVKKLEKLKKEIAAYSPDSEDYAKDARNIINLAKEISSSSISPSIAISYADTLAIVNVLVKY